MDIKYTALRSELERTHIRYTAYHRELDRIPRYTLRVPISIIMVSNLAEGICDSEIDGSYTASFSLPGGYFSRRREIKVTRGSENLVLQELGTKIADLYDRLRSAKKHSFMETLQLQYLESIIHKP